MPTVWAAVCPKALSASRKSTVSAIVSHAFGRGCKWLMEVRKKNLSEDGEDYIRATRRALTCPNPNVRFGST